MDETQDYYGPPPTSHTAFLMKMQKILDWDEYSRQIRESDGFDVDPKTSHNYCYAIIPRRFNPEDETDMSVRLAKLAIHTFNQRRLSSEDTHGELEFVTLLNATVEAVNGFLFYLTFEAMNLDKGNTYTYQAIIYNCDTDKVIAFRLKPTPGSTKTWFWNDYTCGKKQSGEGVSKDPEPIIEEVLEKFVINADAGQHILTSCLRKNIGAFTGASYRVVKSKSDPRKKVLELSGTVDQVQKARPMVLEIIRTFQNDRVIGNETMENYMGRLQVS